MWSAGNTGTVYGHYQYIGLIVIYAAWQPKYVQRRIGELQNGFLGTGSTILGSQIYCNINM